MRTIQTARPTSEAAIFARLGESNRGELSPALARRILKLRFSAMDRARMHQLATKNKRSPLTAAERAELDNFVKVGDLLAIFQSRARRLLKRGTRNGDG